MTVNPVKSGSSAARTESANVYESKPGFTVDPWLQVDSGGLQLQAKRPTHPSEWASRFKEPLCYTPASLEITLLLDDAAECPRPAFPLSAGSS